MYTLPSLEQIANEVLDMNADYRHEPNEEHVHVYDPSDIGVAMEHTKQDESVDSAISLPGSEPSDNKPAQNTTADRHPAQPSVENSSNERLATPTAQISPTLQKSDLPLYRPPLQLSASPEQTRRQLAIGNAQSLAKRKRDSISGATDQMSPKRVKSGSTFAGSNLQPTINDDAELARILQAENNGLRRRTGVVGR